MSNENVHMHLAVVDTENPPNQEPVAANQNPAQGVAAGGPVAGNVENPAPPQVQVVIQEPSQVALDHAQPTPPVVVAAAVIDVPHAVPPNPLQPPVPAAGIVPIPVVIPPAANGNPIHLPLMRTLYGFPDGLMEGEHGEGEDAHDSDDEEA
ncbi:hypothetical protein FRC12_021901 [Ceratobasidium sp. 428]|nr:hypothetical protein FRC12_021901 [Ceratobasidium sp. 428]